MADVNETIKNLGNTKDYTEEFEPQDIENNKVMAILAYIWILVLIPIFAAKDSKFARFHANQGLVLMIVETIFGILIGILAKIPILSWIFGIIGGLVELCAVILAILGIVNALNGKAKDLPVVGKFRILK